MRARIKMTHDHNPYKKGDEFNTSRDYADFLIGKELAKEVKVAPPNRTPLSKTQGGK